MNNGQKLASFSKGWNPRQEVGLGRNMIVQIWYCSVREVCGPPKWIYFVQANQYASWKPREKFELEIENLPGKLKHDYQNIKKKKITRKINTKQILR